LPVILLKHAILFLFSLFFCISASASSLFSDAAVSPTPQPVPSSPIPSTQPASLSGFSLTVVSSADLSVSDNNRSFRVLIYHTHTYEAYTATEKHPYVPTETWRTANNERNVVAVGAYLADILRSAGVEVTHDISAYEPPALSSAYERSLAMLEKRIANGEQYDLYIDLHRDAYSEGNGPNTVQINDESAARLMLLVGKGTGQTGAGYDKKPDFEKNKTLAQTLTNRMNLQTEGLCRPVSVKSGRYNQHIAPCCVLIEVGNNRNTLEEALCAMPSLANAICSLADGQIE